MSEQIKKEVESRQEAIKYHQQVIENLKNECKHEQTFEGLYSWKIGCVDPAVFCSFCGKLIKYKNQLTP